ncbi:MAG: Gfo/Idh/MocA family oxidoreductase [Candidatus Heimdallarchaeota archaeon]|nr:Gfo/Idh/MocA family oxidoreductase [Candidatus Heimdallarchaeota archaeon]
MRICQIGVGQWGKKHARVLSELKSEDLFDELLFYDINKDLGKSISSIYDGTLVDDIENLDVDLVDIVVPANLHYEVAKPFIERGIKVLIEKPFTDKLQHATDLIDISSQPETSIMVGHIFRFHQGVLKTRELINSGVIGPVKKMDIRRMAFGVPRKDNGVIFSLAIHDLDLFTYFLNEESPKSIQALASVINGPTEDHAFIKVEFDNAIGLAEESWSSFVPKKVRSCSIQGELGELSLNFAKPNEVILNEKYIANGLVDNGEFRYIIPFEEPLKSELTHFIETSKKNEKYYVGPEIGIRGVKLCLSALEAAKTQTIVKF